MSNVLKVSHQEAIRSLHEKDWSRRRIARELGINGRTVRRYIEAESKCSTISTAGSEDVSSCDRLGRKSRCEPFETAIGSKMEVGLSAQRIYQNLVEENVVFGFLPAVELLAQRLKVKR